MKITFERRAPEPRADGVLLRLLPQDQRAKLLPPVSEEEFSGKANSLLFLRHEQTLCVGLGERAAIDARVVRLAVGTAARFLRKIGRTRLAIDLENWPQFTGPAVEGAILADYQYEQFKTKVSTALESLRLHVPPEDLVKARKAAARAQVIAECTNAGRDVGNQPGNLLFPQTLAAIAVDAAKRCGIGASVLDERRLRAGGFGGLVSVGEGSSRGPRMVVLNHRGGPKTQRPLVLVGKAVTFDSGGISIKPAANMEEMIFDKCGGMAVLAAMLAIGQLGLKRNVVGLLACAENMPSGTALRPGDIIIQYDGKAVEVINTDAEGRLVLGDAIGYARRDLKAAAIIDLATLTGACGVALGDSAAGFWTSHEGFGGAVAEAAEVAGERIWRMPLYPEHEEQIRSDVALIKNSGGRLGGACTAAAFLKTFAEDTPWAHLDIAYTAHRDKDQGHLARGATGFGVRTLVELAERWVG